MSDSKEMTVAEAQPPQQIALTVQERAVIALGGTERENELKALAQKYADIIEVKNKAGRQQVHGAAMELANECVATKKTGEAAREDAVALQKAVIAREKYLIGLVEPEKKRLLVLRDKWDEDEAAEKAAKAAAEQARIAAIRSRIDVFRNAPAEMVGKSAQQIGACADHLSETVIALEEFEGSTGEAIMARNAAVARLREMQAAQAAHEAEQTRLAAERAQLERERAEAAERERVAAEARAEQERKDREAREAKERRLQEIREEQEATRRAAQAAAEEAMRRQQAEHEARMAAERAEIERQKAEIAATKAEQERREREAREAAEAKAAADKLEADHAEALAENARINAERTRQERERAEILAARYAPEPTGGTWSSGKTWGCIVTTAEIAGCPGAGHNDAEYYGGNLICESVWRPADACVLAAAHDMLAALKAVRESTEWSCMEASTQDAVEAAIAKATYVPEVQTEAKAA